MNKQYFKYLMLKSLKSYLTIFGISLLMYILYVFNQFPRFDNNDGLQITGNIFFQIVFFTAVIATICLAVRVQSKYKFKRSNDFYLSLPISKKTLFITETISILTKILIVFITFLLITLVILIILNIELITIVFILKYFLNMIIASIFIILVYGSTSYLFEKGNTVLAGWVHILIYNLFPVAIIVLISLLYGSFAYNGIAFPSFAFQVSYFRSFSDLIYFINYEGSFWILIAIAIHLSIKGIMSYKGYCNFANYKPQRAEQITKYNLYYKIALIYIEFALLFVSLSFKSYIGFLIYNLFIFAIIISIHSIQKRKFEINKKVLINYFSLLTSCFIFLFIFNVTRGFGVKPVDCNYDDYEYLDVIIYGKGLVSYNYKIEDEVIYEEILNKRKEYANDYFKNRINVFLFIENNKYKTDKITITFRGRNKNFVNLGQFEISQKQVNELLSMLASSPKY